MSADKSRKAAARTEPGTRWESLTGPHARLFICPEEIPAERIRTRWKALRVSGRQRAHTDPERGNVLIINIIGTCPDICRQICHALRNGTSALISGQPNGSGALEVAEIFRTFLSTDIRTESGRAGAVAFHKN